MNSYTRFAPLALLQAVGTLCYRELTKGVEASLDKKRFLPEDTEQPITLQTETDFAARMEHLRPAPPDEARESTLGLPQSPVDREVHKRIKKGLKKLVKNSLVVGEESSETDWNEAMAVLRERRAALIWQLDAVDGSGPQDTAGFGYSANVLLYDTAEDPAIPILSVTVKENGLMLGWIEGYPPIAVYLNVRHGRNHKHRIVTLTEPLADLALVNKERQRWVAVVAAQPQHRELVSPLLVAKSRWTVSTLGGAPAMPGLVVDKLAALVIPEPQTRHDAAPLLALANVGGLFFQDIGTGDMLSPDDVVGFFPGVVRPPVTKGDNPAYTPIPALVIARDAGICRELTSLLAPHMCLPHQQTGSTGRATPHLRIVRSTGEVD